MRALILIAVVLAVAACGRSESPEVTSALAPKDAPDRIDMPAKCKNALTFDNECVELFDKTFGPGAGGNERTRLNNDRAYSNGNAYTPSNVQPAARLGTKKN